MQTSQKPLNKLNSIDFRPYLKYFLNVRAVLIEKTELLCPCVACSSFVQGIGGFLEIVKS